MLNLTRLADEIRFSVQRAADLGGRLSLIGNTVLFHAGNKLSINGSERTFSLRLSVAGQDNRQLSMRRFNGDVFIFYEVFMDEAYRIPDHMLAAEDVRTIVDCGANIGLSALYFADRYPEATIYAIEASATNFNLLKENTRGIDRIVPLHAAVTEPGLRSVRFSTDSKAWGNSIVTEPSGTSEEVRAISLQALAERYGIDRIDLLKVDIEGGEISLFRDPAFLHWTRFGVIELHPPYTMRDFGRDLEKGAFEPVSPAPDEGLNILAFRPAPAET